MSKAQPEKLKEYIRYKYVVENIKDIIWELDPNLLFTFVSPATKEMSGFEPHEIVGRNLLEFLTEKSRKSISQHWKRNLPANYSLFRWGGDEFIILLPDRPLNIAAPTAEAIKTIVSKHDFAIASHQKITISLGIGEYCAQENQDQFISRVDNALLRAKSNGKNQVEPSLFD